MNAIRPAGLFSCTMLLLCAHILNAQTPVEVLGATGVTAGLCLHLGCGDGNLTVGMDNGGKILVHGLAADQSSLLKARSAAKAAGKYGLIAIEQATTWNPLPYASNIASLVIADLDALGPKGLTEQEIARVVAPLGASYVRKNGSWKKTVKPRPSEMDDWTHWQYDATANEVSSDALVQPPTQLQWMSGYRATTGSPGGGGSKTAVPKLHNFGFRTVSGRVMYGATEFRGTQQWRKIRCVDGFSGIPLWERVLNDDRNVADIVVASPERLYTILGTRYIPKDNGYLVGLSMATGEIEKTYDKGIFFKGISSTTLIRSVVHANGTILQADSNFVIALDGATGDVRWKKTLPVFAHHPIIAPDLKLAIVVAGTERRIRSGRNPHLGGVQQLICYDLMSGTEKWRWNFPSLLTPVITQMLYRDGMVVLFGADDAVMHHLSKDAPRTPTLAGIDAATGDTRFSGTYNCPSQGGTYGGLTRPSGSTSCETVYLRDNKIFEVLNWRYHTYDFLTGKETGMTEAGWQRSHTWAGYGCEYQRATVNYHIISGGYVDKNDNVNRQFVTRATCATGFFPANGMIYCNDGGCNCWGMLRGEVAMASDPVLEAADDAKRLDATAVAGTSGAAPAQQWPSGLVAMAWHSNQFEKSLNQIIDTISVGNAKYLNDIHRHTITAMNGTDAVWHFTAGSRISPQMVSAGGLLYVGSHDGWVYCLDEKTGAVKWRFMAAPNDQKMVMCSQVESRWPVLGLTMHDGKLAVCAGWHPEISGGIYTWGLDQSAGHIAWKVRIHSPRKFLEASVAKSAHSNKMLGGELLSSDGQLIISGTSLNTNRDGSVRYYQFTVTPSVWNGQTVDPKTQGVVSVFQPSSRSVSSGFDSHIPQITLHGSKLRVRFGLKTAGVATIRIIDMAGKTVWSQRGTHNGSAECSLAGIAEGSYLAAVKTRERYTTKIIRIGKAL